MRNLLSIYKLTIVSTIMIACTASKFTKKDSKKEEKDGINFFMVGDYGHIKDLSLAHLTFDKMNEIAGNTSDPRNNIDFFLTMGDNIYPTVPEYPT